MHEIHTKTCTEVPVEAVKHIAGFEEISRDYPGYLTDDSKYPGGKMEMLFFPEDEAELSAKMRTPADKFPSEFKETSAPNNASAKISYVASKLHAAMASYDAKSAAELFSNDAVYEDLTLRTQVLGKLAIERYLGRGLAKLPAGGGSSMLQVVGGGMGGGYE